jgi:hypothetical protein
VDIEGRKGFAQRKTTIQLCDSKRVHFVRASRRFNVEKHIEHKKAKDEQSLSDREIWWKIRYLDPDIKRSDSVVIITVLAILPTVGIVVALLYSRGL